MGILNQFYPAAPTVGTLHDELIPNVIILHM